MPQIEITVKEIHGDCEVYDVGDRLVISGPKIDMKKTDKICIHALAPILHYAVALREGIDSEELGLSKEGEKAYISCPDPGEPYTHGGRVVFEVIRTES